MMVAIITQIVSMARTKGAMSSVAVSLIASERPWPAAARRTRIAPAREVAPQSAERALAPGVDGEDRAHAGAKVGDVLIGVEGKAQRHALHHLDPVAAGVLRRQNRELRAGSRRDRGNPAAPFAPRKRVDRHRRGLAGAHVGEVQFLRVGVDPQPRSSRRWRTRAARRARRGRVRSGRPASPRRRSAPSRSCCSSCARRPPPGPWPGCSRESVSIDASSPPPSLTLVASCC